MVVCDRRVRRGSTNPALVLPSRRVSTALVDGFEPADVICEIQVALANAGIDNPMGQGGLTVGTVTISLKCVVETKAG